MSRTPPGWRVNKHYWFVLGVLTVWRLTHLLYGEDGPWGIFVRLRHAAGNGFLGRLLDCFYCLSLWIALPIAIGLGDSWPERLCLWPALSAGAILLERLTLSKIELGAPNYLEDPEPHYGMLRKSTREAPPGQNPGATP